MIRYPTALGALIVALLLPQASSRAQEHGPGPGQPRSVQLPPQLARVLRDYEAGWAKGDAKALSQLFTPDGMALPNGRPPAAGRPAIVEAYAGGGAPLRLRAIAWATADSVGYIIGGYRYGPGDGDIGKFMLALARHGTGPWMIVADIDNSNAMRR